VRSLEKKLTVQAKFEGSNTVTFEGDADEVAKAFLKFLSQVYPSFDLLRRLTVTVDLEDLLRSVDGVFAFSESGPIVLTAKPKMSDKDAVLVHLTRQYLSEKLGRSQSSSMSLDQLSELVGKRSKTVSARLVELMSSCMSRRSAEGSIVSFQRE
jgi:hypothetical protein